MSKINFQTYPIKDLSWGINLNDARTEIDEKQCLKAEGFNFKAWKLIVGETKTNQSTYAGNLQGIYYDYTDIYTVSDWNVYKNWVITYSSGSYTVTFSTIDWIPFSISMDWTTKTYFYNTWIEATDLTNLRNQLIIDYPALTFSAWTDHTITITKGSSFTITNPNYVKKITIGSWSIEKSFDITINWTTKTVAPWTYTTYWDIYTYLVAQYWSYYWRNNWDWTFLFAKNDSTDSTYSVTNKTTYTYRANWSASPWYNAVPNTSSTFPWGDYYWSWDVCLDYLQSTIGWVNYKYTLPSPKGCWLTTAESNFNYSYVNFSADTYQHNKAYAFTDYYVDWLYTQLSSVFTVSNNIKDSNTWIYVNIFRFDFRNSWYTQITQSSTMSNNYYHYSSGFSCRQDLSSVNTWFWITEYTFTSTVSIDIDSTSRYSKINTWTWLSSSTLYRIYKSNYWLLFIGYLWTLWARFVDFSTWVWTWLTWITVTWGHTIWTIYNWKIILWGKILSWDIKNDTIEFSKNYKIGSETDIVNFSWYSAWSQVLSAWNPWYLTWFISWEDWLYAFKNNSVYKNILWDERDWEIKNEDTWVVEYSFKYNFKQVTNSGAYSQECITTYWQEIFYYDWINKSIRRLRYEEQQQTLRDTAISHEIDTLLKAIPTTITWYTQLHSLTFKYPNLEFNYCSTNDLSDNTYWPNVILPNSQVVYNVETSSWFTRALITNKLIAPLIPSNWYYIDLGKEVFDFRNKVDNWIFESKVYPLNWVDSLYKRFGWFDIVWSLIPNSWETKTLEIQILVNWVLEETRTITSTTDLLKFRERIDLYYDWQDIQFVLTHSWKGDLEITDCYITYKLLPYYQSEFY